MSTFGFLDKSEVKRSELAIYLKEKRMLPFTAPALVLLLTYTLPFAYLAERDLKSIR